MALVNSPALYHGAHFLLIIPADESIRSSLDTLLMYGLTIEGFACA